MEKTTNLAISLRSCQELRTTNPKTTALIEARVRQAFSLGYELQRQQTWVPLECISVDVIRAVVVGEDPRFFMHRGLDLKSIKRAVKCNLRELRFFHRGGSTITQQLAKNLYLSEHKNLWRKCKELAIACRLEHHLSKLRILEIYLNVIELGKGVYGVEAAANHHFRKTAANLSANEAAYLAAMMPSPLNLYNPDKNPERLANQQQIILQRMESVVILMPSKALDSKLEIKRLEQGSLAQLADLLRKKLQVNV